MITKPKICVAITTTANGVQIRGYGSTYPQAIKAAQRARKAHKTGNGTATTQHTNGGGNVYRD